MVAKRIKCNKSQKIKVYTEEKTNNLSIKPNKHFTIDVHTEEKIKKLSINYPQFGKKILDKFYLDKNYTNVNHGSYGCCPKTVIEQYQKYQRDLEFNPDKRIRFDTLNWSEEILKLVSDYIDSDSKNLVFIENASDGMNAIMKSLFSRSKKDTNNNIEKILIFDIAYSNTKSIIQYFKDNFEIEKIEFPITEDILNYNENIEAKKKDRLSSFYFSNWLKNLFEYFNISKAKSDEKYLPKSEEMIKQLGFNKKYFLEEFELFIQKNLPIKAAIIDHITSTPALIFPIEEIINILKKYNIISIIDGAHTVGQIDISMNLINPDFYISNFHKWFYAPKTASFLYVDPAFHEKVHPNIITSQYKKGFKNEFLYTGTRDHSVYFSIKDAFHFRNKIGEKEIKLYSKNLAYLAGLIISEIWNSKLLTYDSEVLGNMVNVLIPFNDIDSKHKTDEFIKKVTLETFNVYNVYIPTFKFSGDFFARFSANIYNDIDDYVYAAEKFLEILKKSSQKELYKI